MAMRHPRTTCLDFSQRAMSVAATFFSLLVAVMAAGAGGSRVPIDSAACQQSGHDDAGMILGAGEISHNLHILFGEVVFCEDQEASMGTTANIRRFSIRHEF